MRQLISNIFNTTFVLAFALGIVGLFPFAAGIVTVMLAPAGLWNISPATFTALYTGLWLMFWSVVAMAVSFVVALIAEFAR